MKKFFNLFLLYPCQIKIIFINTLWIIFSIIGRNGQLQWKFFKFALRSKPHGPLWLRLTNMALALLIVITRFHLQYTMYVKVFWSDQILKYCLWVCNSWFVFLDKWMWIGNDGLALLSIWLKLLLMYFYFSVCQLSTQ